MYVCGLVDMLGVRTLAETMDGGENLGVLHRHLDDMPNAEHLRSLVGIIGEDEDVHVLSILWDGLDCKRLVARLDGLLFETGIILVANGAIEVLEFAIG